MSCFVVLVSLFLVRLPIGRRWSATTLKPPAPAAGRRHVGRTVALSAGSVSGYNPVRSFRKKVRAVLYTVTNMRTVGAAAGSADHFPSVNSAFLSFNFRKTSLITPDRDSNLKD